MLEILIGLGAIVGAFVVFGILFLINELTNGGLIVLGILTLWIFIAFNVGRLILGT